MFSRKIDCYLFDKFVKYLRNLFGTIFMPELTKLGFAMFFYARINKTMVRRNTSVTQRQPTRQRTIKATDINKK